MGGSGVSDEKADSGLDDRTVEASPDETNDATLAAGETGGAGPLEEPSADSVEEPGADAVGAGPASVPGPAPGGASADAIGGVPEGTRGSVPTPDPVTDISQRRQEAGVDESAPFGRPGQPLGRAHPFVFGFVGALGVFTAWMLIQAAVQVRQVLVLIVVSMFLAAGLNPAVERLKRLGIRRGFAVAAVFLCVLLAFVGFGFAIVPPLTDQITAFAKALPGYFEQMQNNQRIHELVVRWDVQNRLNTAIGNSQFGQQVFGGILGVGRVVVSGVFSALTVLILTLYFLSSLPSIKNVAYRLAPRSRRARIALLGDEVLDRIGGYVAGTITVAFIAGATSYVFLLIVGVPYALTLALVVSFTAFIPLVGATIGAILVSIVAFFADGTGAGIACMIFFLAYQQFENFVIHPRVMKRAVDVQPAVTVIAALIGGTLLGIVGALLAIPTAAAIALILREVVMPRQEAQ
jgi:predicted PurR-regulated permease PerM